jgi:hypothetical protein
VVGRSAVRSSWGASMDHGAMAQQGGGPEDGPRRRGDVETRAHRFNRDMMAHRRGRCCSDGLGEDLRGKVVLRDLPHEKEGR